MTNRVDMPNAKRRQLVDFVRAFSRAVETEYANGAEPPRWLKNGYEQARWLDGDDEKTWPAPWERS